MKPQELIQELGATGTVGLAIVIAITYIPEVRSLEITEMHYTIMGAGLGFVLRFAAQIIRKWAGLAPPPKPEEVTDDQTVQGQAG